MGAQVHNVWGAEATAPRLMAVDLAPDDSWIGREWQSVSRNCLMPCFGRRDAEEKLRRLLFG